MEITKTVEKETRASLCHCIDTEAILVYTFCSNLSFSDLSGGIDG